MDGAGKEAEGVGSLMASQWQVLLLSNRFSTSPWWMPSGPLRD